MNDILKQRLVGALVIIVLAAVFWPVIFVGPEGEPMDRSSQVPQIPSLRQMQLDKPEPLREIPPAATQSSVTAAQALELQQEPAPQVSSETDPGKQERVQEKVQVNALDPQGIPIAWTLQLISDSKQDKAEVLMQELLDMGYKAYFKAVSHGDGTLYRVYVGPKFERAKLDNAKRVLDKKFRVNSIVTRYLP